MADSLDPFSSLRPTRTQRRRSGWTIRITPVGIFVLVIINLILLGGLAYGISLLVRGSGSPSLPDHNEASETPTLLTDTSFPTQETATSQPTISPTSQLTDTPTPNPVIASPQSLATMALNQGLIILAMDEGGNTHLFAYQPEEVGMGEPLPLTRLTYGPWDDITPAISPDGQSVAFSSNRNGYWDIYLLNLKSGDITRMTDTLGYEAAPSWSPDNQWLVYEAYVNENLEIWIQSVVNKEEMIQLTNDMAADFSPAWSPDGRRILFVSNRSGEEEIWLADLDKGEDQRYKNISQNPSSEDTHPAWSPDGQSLAWVGEQDGMRQLILMGLPPSEEISSTPAAEPQHNLGSGDLPVWSTDGEIILTSLESPNQVYLTAYRTHYPGLALPALELPGPVHGISWGRVESALPVQTIYQQAAQLTTTPLYNPVLAVQPNDNGGRFQLSHLDGVEAPQPYLHDMLDENFTALRTRVAIEAGWDFLSTLENAYVPLTSPLGPGMGNDWLYTGRAFALSTLPMDAGWLFAVREDFSAETYWRVYIRPVYQDGSAGIPLHDQPWDFYSRNNGSTTLYEQGGAELAAIPPGYWIDFTALARTYGWARLPALTFWRVSYPAARFNEFVLSAGLDWKTAMLDIYPPETMITPSPVIPPTRTSTPIPRWVVSPTPTPTSTPRPTLTPFQTLTPSPGG